MRYFMVAAMAVMVLAGCAELTPEQKQNLIMSMERQQEANMRLQAAQAQAYASFGRQNSPTNCITNYVGSQAYTQCQ